MNVDFAAAAACALASTTLVNFAYLREHAAAAAMPPLSLRRPVVSLRLLLGDRRWLVAFAMETTGFALYVAALALAPLALVQSIGAGGVGLLAFASARLGAAPLSGRAVVGVAASVAGLVCLGLSLLDGAATGGHGHTTVVIAWLAASTALAAFVLRAGVGPAAFGIAGGLLFSVGDVATKLVTQGGARIAFAPVLIAGYVLGTALLQLGYQRGDALTVAGLATLLTNALPIAAGTLILGEPIPSGALGVLRVVAFAAVVAGAVLLARPRGGAPPS